MPQSTPIKTYATVQHIIQYFKLSVNSQGKAVEQKHQAPIPDPTYYNQKASPSADVHGFVKGIRVQATVDVDETFKNIPLKSSEHFSPIRHIFSSKLIDMRQIRNLYPSEERLVNQILMEAEKQYPPKEYPGYQPQLIRLGQNSYTTTIPTDIII